LNARVSSGRLIGRRLFAFAPVAVALGAACGPVAAPPPSPIPENSCPPDSCAAYAQPSNLEPATCNGAECASPLGSFDFTLLVSFPETSFTDPGVTVAIPDFMTSYLAALPNQCEVPSCADSTTPCAAAYCAKIPAAIQPQGSFIVSNEVGLCVGRNDKGGASLPVDVQLWPMWANAAENVLVAASSVALPLTPVPGRAFVASSADLIAGLTLPGPSGTPATEWSALAGPGFYEEDIIPQDTAYPPQRVLPGVPPQPITSNRQNAIITSLDQNECPSPTPGSTLDTTFEVTRGSGSLDGFSVYFRDSTTLRRVSSLATLPDASNAPVTILTIGEWDPAPSPGALELVVAPATGAPIPTYIDPIQASQLTLTSFPALPDPVTVSGTVVGPDLDLIDADLLIDSTPQSGDTGGIAICVGNECTPAAYGNAPRPLTYSTTTHVAGGSYSVVLPPGQYNVFIIPGPGVAAGAATSVNPPLLGVQVGLPTAEGKTLVAAARATIRGVAQLADGRALVGATVEVHAAAQLAATTLAQERWPRTVSTLTDDSGAFTLSVDPGALDIVVRPADGTGFPWVTVSDQNIAPGQILSFTPFVVPAPISIAMTLKDEQQQGLAGAVVRAFASPPDAGASVPGGPPPEVELGAWLTDSNGSFSMFIAPPQ
jgi:hypothetical protein